MPIEKLEKPTRIDEERIQKLKELFPEAFADGKLNLEILQEEINGIDEQLIENNTEESYGLQWVGKKEARRLAFLPPQGTLKFVEGEGVNEEEIQNLLIEGENLETLRVLQKSYSGKIKMIYIDPPYNTGRDFVYKDNFREPLEEYLIRSGAADEEGLLTSNPKSSGRFHANWLNMMYPRLKLARNLLKSDGVIFISIDDNELSNLLKIMDEIFGEENFVGIFIWRKKYGGGQAETHFITEHEYVVVYRKSASFVWKDEQEAVSDEGYNRTDELGRKYKIVKLAKWGNNARKEDRPSMHFPITAPDGSTCLPYAPDGNLGRWRVGKTKMKELLEKNLVHWERKGDRWEPYEKQYFDECQSKIIKQRSILYNLAQTGDGSNTLTQLFNIKDIFENPKPVELVKLFIKHTCDEGDIVLDFFAGSGTTGHAVLEFVKEEGKNVKFILIQIPEPTPEKSEARKNGYSTIFSITKERLKKSVEWLNNLQEENENILGFKVFRLTQSNFRKWSLFSGENIAHLEKNLDIFTHAHFTDGWTEKDVIIELMLNQGFPLDSCIEQVKEIDKNKVWVVKHEDIPFAMYVCLDQSLRSSTVDYLVKAFSKDVFICLDDALNNEQKILLGEEIKVKTI